MRTVLVLAACLFFAPAAEAQDRADLARKLAGKLDCGKASREACAEAAALLERMAAGMRADALGRLADGALRVALIPEGVALDKMPQARPLLEDRAELEKVLGPLAELGGVACIKQEDGAYVTLVNEANLLAGKAYYPKGFNFLHEMGHTVYRLGLGEDRRKALEGLYRRAKKLKLKFPDRQSASHHEEYFAQGTAIWFGVHGAYREKNPGVGAEWLKANQPEFFQALREIYAADAADAAAAGECAADADCRLIYSNCDCEAVPAADPRKALESLAVCKWNLCSGTGVAALCRENKCVKSGAKGK